MHSITKNAAIFIRYFVLALVLFAPAVLHGDEWNWKTRFMLSQPAEIPGTVVEPNTRYVIKVFDSPSERHVVLVYNDDESKLLTTFMCAAEERTVPTDKRFSHLSRPHRAIRCRLKNGSIRGIWMDWNSSIRKNRLTHSNRFCLAMPATYTTWRRSPLKRAA